MPLSHTLTVTVDRPYRQVDTFMSDPKNFGKWAAVVPGTYRKQEGGDWLAEVTFGGVRHIRFVPGLGNGIYDHAVFRPGEIPLFMPMRAMRYGEKTEVRFTFVQRSDMSVDSFHDTIACITRDLTRLKDAIEADYYSTDQVSNVFAFRA